MAEAENDPLSMDSVQSVAGGLSGNTTLKEPMLPGLVPAACLALGEVLAEENTVLKTLFATFEGVRSNLAGTWKRT